MTEEELNEIEARANAATEGPWWRTPAIAITSKARDVIRGIVGLHWTGDLEFIAHARTDVPALVAEVRLLKTKLQAKSAEAELERLRDDFRECPSCAANPGSPGLCRECLERRALVAEVRRLQPIYLEKSLAIRARAIEECARAIENAPYLHAEAPDAKWGQKVADFLRRMK